MNPSSSTDSTISSGRSPDAISRRAYEIWEREGRPEGNDLKHWLQAEQELGDNSTGSSANQSEARNAPSDTRPLQGTRAAQAASRPAKRQSAAPFPNDKNAATGPSNGNGKRKPANAPAL